MQAFFTEHSVTEMGLIVVIGTIGIVAACQDQWPTAGAVIAGGFAILKGRRA